MEASMLTEWPCEVHQRYLQRKKGLGAEMLIEKAERLRMMSPPRTLKASSQMWGPRKIFAQGKDPQEVLMAPCLLDVEECHPERDSSSAVELCPGRLYDWQQVLWRSGHSPSFPPFLHSPRELPSSTGFEDLLATAHMVQTPHLPHILQGLLRAPHSSSQPPRPPSHSSPSLSGAVANISL